MSTPEPPTPRLATPDVTTVQMIAIAQAVVAVLVALGIDMSAEKEHAIIQLATAVGIILPIADAIIRHGRATGTALRDKGES